MWGEMSPAKRWSLLLGVLAIVLGTAVAVWWLLRVPYAVLFSDMKEQDAGIMAQELDKLKVPYQVAAGGQTLLVPESAVHKTRMALMGKQLPLNGAVGFELFNNAEFGVSDFVQKVNFQRALQGELTRTILSIEQILSARVHLALPEQGLFRKENHKAKASVTVVTKPGQALAPGQVLGIQRLVGASVPEVRSEDVTVLDQNGVTLSRSSADNGAVSVGADQFDSKVGLETLLAAKAIKVLEGMFGDGNALVTVDAALNHQQTTTTTEEVLPAMGTPKGGSPAGVVVRERTVSRDSATADTRPSGTTTSQDVDYQNGKRVEKVLAPAGAVLRLNVAVVVKRALSDADMARVKEVVASSVGLNAARGDGIAVFSMANPSSLTHAAQLTVATETTPQAVQRPMSGGTPAAEPAGDGGPLRAAIASGGLMAAAMLALGLAAWTLRRRNSRLSAAVGKPMSAREREAVLRSVQRWLAQAEGKVDV